MVSSKLPSGCSPGVSLGLAPWLSDICGEIELKFVLQILGFAPKNQVNVGRLPLQLRCTMNPSGGVIIFVFAFIVSLGNGLDFSFFKGTTDNPFMRLDFVGSRPNLRLGNAPIDVIT